MRSTLTLTATLASLVSFAVLTTAAPIPDLHWNLTNPLDLIQRSIGNRKDSADKLNGHITDVHDTIAESIPGVDHNDDHDDGLAARKAASMLGQREDGGGMLGSGLRLGGILGESGKGDGQISGFLEDLFCGEDYGVEGAMRKLLGELGLSGDGKGKIKDMRMIERVGSLQELAEEVGVSVEKLLKGLKYAIID